MRTPNHTPRATTSATPAGSTPSRNPLKTITSTRSNQQGKEKKHRKSASKQIEWEEMQMELARKDAEDERSEDEQPSGEWWEKEGDVTEK
jgi:hypothetical protein